MKKVWSYILPALLIFAAIFCLERYLLEVVQVSGPSMDPNLYSGQQVVAFKHHKIEHGDVVIFSAAQVDPKATLGTMYVKRIIGLPGDKIESREDGIYVNDRLINQNYLKANQEEATGVWTLNSLAKAKNWRNRQNYQVVPQNKYFVLGDNRMVSNDSRNFGFVPTQSIVGKVKVPFWSHSTKQQRENINQEHHYFYE